jgi:hypothetical protein
MQPTTLARYGAPIAIVAGALMIITRLVILFTTPAEIGPLKAYVLTTTHAVNSVVSILGFALLVIALVALYDREARSAGAFGALAFGAAVIGTMFMTGDWWYEAFAVPRLAEVAPDVVDTFVGGRLIIGGLTSFALFGIGWIMYGAASTRARVIPEASRSPSSWPASCPACRSGSSTSAVGWFTGWRSSGWAHGC